MLLDICFLRRLVIMTIAFYLVLNFEGKLVVSFLLQYILLVLFSASGAQHLFTEKVESIPRFLQVKLSKFVISR